MSVREPLLRPVPIADLKPTQMTVGFREVEQKRLAWRRRAAASEEKGAEFLGTHMIPVVLGPKGKHYILDHHHLCRALAEEGVKDILVNVIADLSRLGKASMWVYLDNRGWCHPYDAAGERQSFDAIPGTVGKMTDDPFRSLAGELRRSGGFAKDTTPFSEFIWADFLRGKLKAKLIVDNFDEALKKAMTLAKGKDADYLPGWCGPTD